MKKVLAVALACAVSSFAAWDRFPVVEHGKGEVKFSTEQSRRSTDETDGGFGLKVRYSPMENLELMAKNWGDAFGNYVVGVRYQILPGMLSAGVDVGFPINATAWSFTPGVQFLLGISQSLAFAANVDLAIYTETSDNPNAEPAPEYARGMDISGGVEVDFTIGQSTIWAGVDFATGLSKSERGGNEAPNLKADGRQLSITPAIGYFAALKETLEVGTWVGFSIATQDGNGDGDTDPMTTIVGVDAKIKF